MKKRIKKLYIVRKYIMAISAKEAIKKDLDTEVDDVWVDDDWKKNNQLEETKKLGFNK